MLTTLPNLSKLHHSSLSKTTKWAHEPVFDTTENDKDDEETRFLKGEMKNLYNTVNGFATEDTTSGNRYESLNDSLGSMEDWRAWYNDPYHEEDDLPDNRLGGFLETVVDLPEYYKMELVIYIVRVWLPIEPTIKKENIQYLEDIAEFLIDEIPDEKVVLFEDRLFGTGMLSGERTWRPLYNQKIYGILHQMLERAARPGGENMRRDAAQYPKKSKTQKLPPQKRSYGN